MSECQVKVTLPVRTPRRLGLTLVETMVACSLLTAVLVVFAPMVRRNHELQRDLVAHRLAWEELCNQMEQLHTVPLPELESSVNRVSPSAKIVERLPGVVLRGNWSESLGGQRIELQVNWGQPNQRGVPLSLVAWRYSPSADREVSP